MSRMRLIMSTRNEKAKRLNANEDNLLQMEKERFQKQHNKEMKSIILERQTAKEAINDVRRQRASSLLAARRVLQETNQLDDRCVNSPALSEKVLWEAKQNYVPSKMVPGLETEEDRLSCWKTYLRSPRIRPRSSTEGTTDARSNLEGASLRSGSRLNYITISRNLANQYREQQGNSAVQNIPLVTERVADDNRAKSHSDDSMLFKRVSRPKRGLEKRNLSPNGPSSARSRRKSPGPDSFHSPLILRVVLPRTPPVNRRVSSETGSKLLAKRISLEPSHKSQSQNKLSPSRGIAKFRQTGSAAAVAQTLVLRYQREKAISNATENLIAERQRRDKVREEHQQMKDD